MRKIDRCGVVAPPFLASYSHLTHSWDERKGKEPLTGPHKKELREVLRRMQHGCCAYCESLTWGQGHIEHFRRKRIGHFPELTFSWDNLFFSCNGGERGGQHCGHHKDHKNTPAYDPKDLIKPDIDDPDDFLFFSAGGGVAPKSGLPEDSMKRAEETIRVFNLNAKRLQKERRKSFERYFKILGEELEEVESWADTDARDWIRLEVEEVRTESHGAVIRHYLMTAGK